MKTILLVPIVLSLGIQAHAQIVTYSASLDGLSESPSNASPGTGSATLTYNSVASTMALTVTFSGLIGNTTASHIHGPTASPGTGTAGVMTTLPTFPGFPLGVTSGTYANVFDLTMASSWNASFITAHGGTTAGAEAALAAALAGGTAYLNIHTTAVPGGEIRGFFAPVPEPAATAVLAAAGLVGFGLIRRRRQQG